eukprot:6213752-Pleurochrysis_carterae.AAC.6
MAAPQQDKTHLVVAVQGSARYWRGGGQSAFGKAFLASANDPAVKARVAHEAFESSVCLVASDDLDNFFNGIVLHYDGAL